MSDQIPVFTYCPRCGEMAYDILRTHAYCVECNYSPDFDYRPPDVPEWATKLLTAHKGSKRKRSNSNSPRVVDSNTEVQSLENHKEGETSAGTNRNVIGGASKQFSSQSQDSLSHQSRRKTSQELAGEFPHTD